MPLVVLVNSQSKKQKKNKIRITKIRIIVNCLFMLDNKKQIIYIYLTYIDRKSILEKYNVILNVKTIL